MLRFLAAVTLYHCAVCCFCSISRCNSICSRKPNELVRVVVVCARFHFFSGQNTATGAGVNAALLWTPNWSALLVFFVSHGDCRFTRHRYVLTPRFIARVIMVLCIVFGLFLTPLYIVFKYAVHPPFGLILCVLRCFAEVRWTATTKQANSLLCARISCLPTAALLYQRSFALRGSCAHTTLTVYCSNLS